jgi:hypothetical protein
MGPGKVEDVDWSGAGSLLMDPELTATLKAYEVKDVKCLSFIVVS